MNYLLSYPRSGVTWLRYCIEELTGRPTLGASSSDHPICNRDGVNLNVDPQKDFVAFKRHWWNGEEFSSEDHITLVIRNHVEILSRHRTKDGHSTQRVLEEDAPEYVNNIKKFDSFGGGKYVVYYEDIIKDKPLKEILYDFVDLYDDASEERLISLMESIDHHRKISLQSYPKSHTKGEKEVYHQKEVDDDLRKRFDERVKELMDEDLFEKYLSRYKAEF